MSKDPSLSCFTVCPFATGHYYNYDCSTCGNHDSIMADQLAGNWYMKASGITDDTVSNLSTLIHNRMVVNIAVYFHNNSVVMEPEVQGLREIEQSNQQQML